VHVCAHAFHHLTSPASSFTLTHVDVIQKHGTILHENDSTKHRQRARVSSGLCWVAAPACGERRGDKRGLAHHQCLCMASFRAVMLEGAMHTGQVDTWSAIGCLSSVVRSVLTHQPHSTCHLCPIETLTDASSVLPSPLGYGRRLASPTTSINGRSSRMLPTPNTVAM
jgi:hypothetical protein